MKAGSIINRASLHRRARTAFAERGLLNDLPRGGMEQLETYLTAMADGAIGKWADAQKGREQKDKKPPPRPEPKPEEPAKELHCPCCDSTGLRHAPLCPNNPNSPP